MGSEAEAQRAGMWTAISAWSDPYRMHPLLVRCAPVQLAQCSRLRQDSASFSVGRSKGSCLPMLLSLAG